MRESEKKTDDEKCHAMENANQPTCPPLPVRSSLINQLIAARLPLRRAADLPRSGTFSRCVHAHLRVHGIAARGRRQLQCRGVHAPRDCTSLSRSLSLSLACSVAQTLPTAVAVNTRERIIDDE